MQLAVYQPDIPQNLGAAMRLSACFGVSLHVVEPCGFPLTDKGLRRAALDYAPLTRTVRHASWTAFHHACREDNRRIVLLTTKGAAPLWQVQFTASDVVVCGRESAGAPDEVHQAADIRAVIPLTAAARSLNVVTAAAIALGEASRQLGLEGMGEAS